FICEVKKRSAKP
ncbi:hypothetical protein VCHENC02_0866B, partial [Vibrio harveyi]